MVFNGSIFTELSVWKSSRAELWCAMREPTARVSTGTATEPSSTLSRRITHPRLSSTSRRVHLSRALRLRVPFPKKQLRRRRAPRAIEVRGSSTSLPGTPVQNPRKTLASTSAILSPQCGSSLPAAPAKRWPSPLRFASRSRSLAFSVPPPSSSAPPPAAALPPPPPPTRPPSASSRPRLPVPRPSLRGPRVPSARAAATAATMGGRRRPAGPAVGRAAELDWWSRSGFCPSSCTRRPRRPTCRTPCPCCSAVRSPTSVTVSSPSTAGYCELSRLPLSAFVRPSY
jgi:hypothetical protein